MPEKKPELDFTNNYYLVLSISNLKEFVRLLEAIKNYSKKKKAIPEETIDRFYSMIKPLRSVPKIAESAFRDEDIAFRTFEVIEFIREHRNYKQYMFKKEKVSRWYDGFDGMIYAIVTQLILVKALNKHDWDDKDFCIKEAYKLFENYKIRNMSLNQQHNYRRPYKFIALSAIIADKVFSFHISSSKEMSIYEYHQHALNALKKYNVR